MTANYFWVGWEFPAEHFVSVTTNMHTQKHTHLPTNTTGHSSKFKGADPCQLLGSISLASQRSFKREREEKKDEITSSRGKKKKTCLNQQNETRR